MEKFFAYQKDSREPCKYGRKCFQKNKEHIDKYKHPPTKDDIKVNDDKKPRKRDSKGKVKYHNSNSNGESSNSNQRNDLNNVENHTSQTITDLEVPEQSINTVISEASSSRFIDNETINSQPNSTLHVMPQIRQRSHQQQQLLLTNTALEDCSGDDSIVPSTPTLFTPRRLDGETVSSPHVPSNNLIQKFTFLGESHASQLTESNDGERMTRSEPIARPAILTNTTSWKKRITQLFLVGDMPKEFYDFWYFCKKLCPNNPADAFLPVGLILVGPYDVLAGKMNEFDTNDTKNAVLHWRYYYDPPEFQTILASTSSQFHIGYFRDEPLAMPVFIASNDSGKNCIIQNLGKSLFHALWKYLQNISGEEAYELQKKLHTYEKQNVNQILDGRKTSAVAKTFHKAGIVVPYDRKTDIGYRPLSESESVLRKILKCYCEASDNKKIEEMDKLQAIITYANIAIDECDFGTGLELGIDIFCDGNPELHRMCMRLLVTVYSLLRRPQFANIIKAHLNNRRNDANMSIL